MLSLLVYNQDADKGGLLRDTCNGHIKKRGRKIEVSEVCTDTEKFSEQVCELNGPGIFMVRKDEQLDRMSEILESFENTGYPVMVVGSPDELFGFVSLSFHPVGFLPENADESRAGQLIDEIYKDYLRLPEASGGPEYHFKIKGVSYTESFPNIYMIEVQSKRITFRTESQCYEFYDSLEAVMKAAPDYFVRVHRSYVINLRYISNIDMHEKIIVLNDSQRIFFSRNYAADLWEKYIQLANEGGFS